MGLGAALMENVTLNEDGKVTTPSLGEYKLPTMRDIPPLRTILLQAPLGDGPFGTAWSANSATSAFLQPW